MTRSTPPVACRIGRICWRVPGRRLIAAACHLKAAGFPGMALALAVVEQNLPVHGFYAARGGIEAGRFQDRGPL